MVIFSNDMIAAIIVVAWGHFNLNFPFYVFIKWSSLFVWEGFKWFQVTQFFQAVCGYAHKQGAFISKLGILFYLITFLHDTRKRRAKEKAREISGGDDNT